MVELVVVTNVTSSAWLNGAVRLERKIFMKHESIADSLVKEAKKPQNTMVLAIDPDTDSVCGYLLFRRSNGVGYLDKLAVTETRRRQGIGRSLLQFAIELFRNNRGSVAHLWVDVERTGAIALYESQGFIIEATRPDYYRPGRGAYVMTLRL